MKDFKTLAVWEKSHRLVLRLYGTTQIFPKQELFGLSSQIRRSASSIPTNIAEGCGRNSDADFARFLQIAFGSACELEYHLILTRDLKYVSEEEFLSLTTDLIEIKKMLAAFISRVRTNG
jgi:four helix bundle protein